MHRTDMKLGNLFSNTFYFTLSLVWLAVGFMPLPVFAQATATPSNTEEQAQAPSEGQSDWIRVVEDENGDIVAMQTAITRYASRDAQGHQKTVDLVGAVHVGDASYYSALNRRFDEYDVVLYELVAPDGTVVPRGGGERSSHPVANIQTAMQEMLELEHQLAQIDYTKRHFVHADMSPDDFSKSMRNRNESFVQMYFRLVGQSIGQQSRQVSKGKTMNFDLMAALFSKDRARQLKIVLAEQLAESENLFASFGGTAGSTLITERNKVALAGLREQLAAGKKKVAIFYGAGHYADMDQRLRADFGMKPVSTSWITAWDLKEGQ